MLTTVHKSLYIYIHVTFVYTKQVCHNIYQLDSTVARAGRDARSRDQPDGDADPAAMDAAFYTSVGCSNIPDGRRRLEDRGLSIVGTRWNCLN